MLGARAPAACCAGRLSCVRAPSRARAARRPAATGPGGGGGLSEEALKEVVAKLAAAEAEAAKLRDELAAKEAASLAGKSQEELARLKPAKLASGLRIDSTEARLGGGASPAAPEARRSRGCDTRAP